MYEPKEEFNETGSRFFTGLANALAIMATLAGLIWLGKCFIDALLG